MSTALLHNYALPFNPNSVQWSYKLNTATFETLGGRVVQVLSTKITGVRFEAEAGSAARLTEIATKVQQIMRYHVDTERPVRFEFPARGWVMDVFLSSMPTIGFDVETVSFPYQLEMEVSEDFNTVTERVMGAELERLAMRVGYDPRVHGGDIENANMTGAPTETVPPMHQQPAVVTDSGHPVAPAGGANPERNR